MVLAAENIGGGVLDDVVGVVEIEQIGFVFVAAGDVVDARAAIERVGVAETVDLRLAAGGSGGVEIPDDVFPVLGRAVGERETVDAVEPQRAEDAVVGVELAENRQHVVGAVDRDL